MNETTPLAAPGGERKPWTAVVMIGLAFIIACVALGLTLSRGSTSGLSAQVTSLQHQVAQDHAQIVQLRSQQASGSQAQQIAKLNTEVAELQARLLSASPFGNLITCSDLHSLNLQYTYGVTTDSSGNLMLQQNAVPDPAHCFK